MSKKVDPGLNFERFAYWAVRTGLMAMGLLVILGTLCGHFVLPDLLYDDATRPLPLLDRLPEILAAVGLGLLMCVPYRWTRPAFVFSIRMAASVLLAGFLFWQASGDMIYFMHGGSRGSLVRAMICVGVAIAIPLSLWWSQRIGLMPSPVVVEE